MPEVKLAVLKWGTAKPASEASWKMLSYSTTQKTLCGRYMIVSYLYKGNRLYIPCVIETKNGIQTYQLVSHEQWSTTSPKKYNYWEEALAAIEAYREKNSDPDISPIATSAESLYKKEPKQIAPKEESSQVTKSTVSSVAKIEQPVNSIKKGSKMKLRENRVRRLFKSMGFRAVDTWTIESLSERANQLPSLSRDKPKPDDEKDQALLARMVDSISDGDEIELVEDVPVENDPIVEQIPKEFLTEEESNTEETGEPVNEEETAEEEQPEPVAEAPKRGRGRPRKVAAPVDNNGEHTSVAVAEPPKKAAASNLTPCLWREVGPAKLLKATAQLASKFYNMERFPRDRDLQPNRVKYLTKEIEEGRFRGCEWVSCHVKDADQVYRMNGKHTSYILNTMFADSSITPVCTVLVREYECDTMEDAAVLFSTFDAKQNSRSKADVIRGYAVAHEVTADLPPKILNVLTASLAYAAWGDPYRRFSPSEQAKLLFANLDFAEWVKVLVGGKKPNEYKHMVRMSVFAAMLQTWSASPKQATKFWVDIRDDSDGNKNTPQRTLYRYLIGIKVGAGDGERVGDREVLVKCLQAWNAWRAGDISVKLKYTTGADIPVAV